MPKIRFTDRSVKALRPPETGQIDYFDTSRSSPPGFGVRVSYGGTRTWILLYRHAGRPRRMKVGMAGGEGALSLASARRKAGDALRVLDDGRDPVMVRKAREAEQVAAHAADRFKQLASTYVEEYAKKHKRSWRKDKGFLDGYFVPELGRERPQDITRAHIRKVLGQINTRGGPIAANRGLEVIRKLFNWAISERETPGLVANPAAGLKRPNAETERSRTMTSEEIAVFWRALDGIDRDAADMWRLMLILDQRRNELKHMRWRPDLDLPEGWWNLDGSYTKTGNPYRVPLPKMALDIIERRSAAKTDPEWVFPKRGGGGPISYAKVKDGFLEAVKVAGIKDLRPHDLVHTATTMMTSMGISQFIVSKIRHHSEGGKKLTTGRYDHATYDREKRAALDAWALRLLEIVTGRAAASNVVPITPQAAAQ